MSSPLRILFAGAGEFGLPTLAAIRDAGHDLVHVYSQPDRPAGRGRKLAPTAIAQFALDHAIPVTRTENLNADPLPAADLLVVIAFGQKISAAVTNHPLLGAVNLHSSRLPKFRGAAPINWAILAGDSETGNSIIRLADRMDAGAVLAMSTLTIGELETAGELHDRLAADGAPLMLRTIEQLAAGTATETPQDESQATRAIKLNRESSKIDWSKSADAIARQIRGMYPWPGCRVKLVDADGKELARLTLVRACGMGGSPMIPPRDMGGSPMPDNSGGPPESRGATVGGPPMPRQITAAGTVQTGDGQLDLFEIQPEGKRPMPLTAYRNGHPWNAGMRLESLT